MLVAWEGPAGEAVPLLVVRAGPAEREALLSMGHPFFASRAGRDRIGVLLTNDTDWQEIRELVTDSYRILAPKKLTAPLERRRRRRPKIRDTDGSGYAEVYLHDPRAGR